MFMLLPSEGRAVETCKLCLSFYRVFPFIPIFHHTSRHPASSAFTVYCNIFYAAKNTLSRATASLFHAIFSFSHHDTPWPPADGSPLLVTAGIPISTVNMIISLPNTEMTREFNLLFSCTPFFGNRPQFSARRHGTMNSPSRNETYVLI
jgi:hypothetical protein